VIFGKTNTEAVNLANISKVENTAAHAIDFQGDTNTNKNDTLTGTSADELISEYPYYHHHQHERVNDYQVCCCRV
jgi:hypothetical protein